MNSLYRVYLVENIFSRRLHNVNLDISSGAGCSNAD